MSTGKTAFREMLGIEIQQNLEMLAFDLKSISEYPDNVSEPLWMAGVACPAWSTTTWDSGLALWPDIFSDRQQRMDLQAFYAHLRSLSAARTFLTTLVLQARDPDRPSEQRTRLVHQAKKLAEDIQRRGSPLQSHTASDGNAVSPGSAIN